MKIIQTILEILLKWLGIKEIKNADPDIKAATKKRVEVETRDIHEKSVAEAIDSGDLDDIRRRAGQ